MKIFYDNPHCLLVVNPKGCIRKLYTPFRVQIKDSGLNVYVDEVQRNEEKIILFKIQGRLMPYSQYFIKISF